MISPKAALDTARQKRPFFDHVVRMYQRYQADAGDRLASAVTYYWFLSLFPILLIAVYVTSLVLGDDAGRQVTGGLDGYLGRSTAEAIGKVVQDSAGKAGVIGLVGTLLSGLGWIQGLREAIRTIWHQNVTAGNFLTKKLADVFALVGLFAVIAASVVISGAATASTGQVLDLLGVSDSAPAKALTFALSYLLGALVDVLIFLYLFVRLAKVPTPVRPILRGAVFGAVGFELLKFVAAFYIGRTTSKGEATYGSFAVVVGLLLFLNLVSRLILYTAAFIVTAPYDDDVRPSGTADAAQARKAGIPEEYADTDLNVNEDGAPSPLAEALQGKVGTMQRSWESKAPRDEAGPTAPTPASPAPPLPGAQKVQLAATVTAAAGGAVLTAVGIHAVRTVQGLMRR